MADTFSASKRSEIMRLIRSYDTGPERKLGAILKSILRDDEEVISRPSTLPGKPDFFIPVLCIAVFCDGCFFHGCPRHFRLPEQNREYWERKVSRNKALSRRSDRLLRTFGIVPVHVWEHELQKCNEGRLVAKLRRIVSRQRATGQRAGQQLP